MNTIWYKSAVLRVQYGKGPRPVSGRGPDSPEGNLSETQLAQNRDDFPHLGNLNEFIDDDYHRERTNGDFSKIQVPVLSAGNWVCRSFQNAFVCANSPIRVGLLST